MKKRRAQLLSMALAAGMAVTGIAPGMQVMASNAQEELTETLDDPNSTDVPKDQEMAPQNTALGETRGEAYNGLSAE